MTGNYQTDFVYRDREEKAEYVSRKYGEILRPSVLDVGADQCYLRGWLEEGVKYVGIGIGDGPDIRVDLEKEDLPFSDEEIACVLCLDVLEHLENIHHVFDELCRVSSQHVLISLPNPYQAFLGLLATREVDELKFYGLPSEKPEDRHRWFFSSLDAKRFIEERASRNGFRVEQLDFIENRRLGPKQLFKKTIFRVLSWVSNVEYDCFAKGTCWALLSREAHRGASEMSR